MYAFFVRSISNVSYRELSIDNGGWPIQARFWLEWGSSTAAGSHPFRADITTTEVAPPFALFKGWEPRMLAR
jgi:hypothetical protein